MSDNLESKENALWTINNLYISTISDTDADLPRSLIIETFVQSELKRNSPKRDVLGELCVWHCYIISCFKHLSHQGEPLMRSYLNALETLLPLDYEDPPGYLTDLIRTYVNCS